MEDRLARICSELPRVRVFADVGCDHGYCTEYALRRGLCERAYLSDISAGSLSKAEKLLSREIAAGRCFSVVADGMHGLPEPCDGILIAGMGGEEIVRILSEGYLPERFVLQPMKNSDKVRAFLLSRGCRIERDFTFGEKKFYDLIVGTNAGGDEYSDWEIAFGRDNLRAPSAAFRKKLEVEKSKLRALLGRKTMQPKSRAEILRRLSDTEVVSDAIEGDL